LSPAGRADAGIDQLACPIGIPEIVGKQPAVIGASCAAQLLTPVAARAGQVQTKLGREARNADGRLLELSLSSANRCPLRRKTL
jgi:xanthine/CO dehydrogenase XdhC/CoxF family maturation factor